MKISIALLSGGFMLGSLFAPAVVQAQTIANDVLECGLITDDGARLRCFDGLLPEARKTEDQRRTEAAAKAKADFGLTATQRSEAVEREPEEKRKKIRIAQEENLRIDATITNLDISRYGTIFVLDNGQTWQTTSYGQLNTVPRIGQKVKVISGGLGGYRLTLEGKTSEVGVKRLK